MPVTPTYPGVYIEELPSGIRTITGVATSITAFVGRSRKGPANSAVRIQSFADYERLFGGLWAASPMSYSVQQFFAHGGKDAIVVRVHTKEAVAATLTLPTSGSPITLSAASPGSWGNALRAIVDYPDTLPSDVFNLTLQELESVGSNRVVTTETFRNLSIQATSPRFVKSVLEQGSKLVRLTSEGAIARPTKGTINATAIGTDGGEITAAEVSASGLAAQRHGLYALDQADLFNLLCIPPLSPDKDVPDSVLTVAASYCQSRRALLLVDAPSSWSDPAAAESGLSTILNAVGDAKDYAALYFPRLQMADPLKENRTEEFAPSGAIAGIIARTDAERGVWKAPAGIDAGFSGVRELSYKLTDGENGRLNPLGINCLRSFPVYGNVVWGARTMAGADQLASEWKYLPVRRMALFLEESLYRGTQWVVFEPNDEPLWAQIRLNLGAFMNNLFRQGAFQGKTPKEAYFVKCDRETTTQNDINLGIVNIIVGFAPLKPAEFVIIKFQQMAGQVET